ncbi:non-ribosomal peptide synthase protein (TIGR01720 family)/amino acid adenylation domain-containing protein [Saccharothrix carnea]|uniref:Non-ribosomal peptide synthase protein (TIGR01720 family)/amino acid adenylation domain-containing protein n=1 Tax=Saccharothrix carnea TaxID=1280637 RepID=A0A2P8IF19_SACCR|nr:non-ribosomal peptide synthetase [Saccharothrix carnea]PSL57066.1 non-ribosomal peptide synthase protein (TIGR01720 family)/amino acid adenylation domain-containing protein [Saccharothrix carnea]
MGVEHLSVGSVHDLFAARVAAEPDRISVVCGAQRLTFRELAAGVDAVTGGLLARGVRPEDPVGLLVERGVDAVVALLAILRAGGAVVPLAVDLPDARLAELVIDARPALVLTRQRFAHRLPGVPTVFLEDDHPPSSAPPPRLTPDHLAYVLHTSGSTGRPNGVLATHRGLLALHAHHSRGLFASVSPLKVAHTAGFGFDAMWLPVLWMLAGHELHVIDDDALADPRTLVDHVVAAGIDVLDETPSRLRELLRAGLLEGGHRPRVVVTGGEPVDPDLCARLVAAGVAAHNAYGTTEVAVESLLCPVTEVDQAVLGHPIAGARAHVLDADLRPADEGELYLAGPGVARGYLGRPGLTAASFVADPHGPPGSRMYRTGDLVRRRPDGLLDHLGRVGGHVKVRGARVDPGEVEATLLRHPDVSAAAVVLRDDRLVAYVVADRPPDVLRSYLADLLPAPAVPSLVVPLAALPLTANGKLDRRNLPRPRPTGPVTPPRTPAEERVAAVWRDVLGVERVGADDDFVALGGDSILAMRVVAALDRNLPARQVFALRTVEALAAALSSDQRPRPGVDTTPPETAAPLSYAQERLWFLDEFAPGGTEYTTTAGFRLRGEPDPDALGVALTRLVARHEQLRTTFHTVDGRGTQVVVPPHEVRVESGTQAGLADFVARPFDLRTGPLLRAALLAADEDGEHLLVLCLHHIVTDGWSMGVLAQELGLCYSAAVRGQEPDLAPLPLRYTDFARRQRSRLTGAALDAHLVHWERRLAGMAVLDLPVDRPRPAVRTAAGSTHRRTVPPEVAEGLVELGRGHGATLFTTLMAATQAFLARVSGQRDIAVGTVTSGRDHPDLAGLVGFFVNTVVIRSQVDPGLSFVDFLRRVKDTVRDALDHDDVPFHRLVELLQPERDAGRSPLVNVVVALQNAPAAPPELAGLEVVEFDPPRQAAVFDLTLEFTRDDSGLHLVVEYSTDLFDDTTVTRLVDRFLVLLDHITADPHRPLSRLRLLTPGERRQVLHDWTSGAPSPDRTITGRFADHVAERPDAVAVTCDGRSLTYRELDGAANRLAHGLLARGVRSEDRVGLCAPRGLPAIVALLGILKAGAAFVPLDPGYPVGRLADMITDSGARLVLAPAGARERLPAGIDVVDPTPDDRLPDQAPPVVVRPRNAAYVMFTSGSTGRPKGVLVEHRSVARLAEGDPFPIGPHDVVAQCSTLSFDASTFEIWAALLSGARLAVSSGTLLSPDDLRAFTAAHGVTVQWLTAGLFHEVAAADPTAFAGLRHLGSGGDVISPGHCAAVLRHVPDLRIVDGYGPTEGTTFASAHVVRPIDLGAASLPIGRPVTGTRCYVLDENLDPVPVGVPGELHIGGTGLARGYLDHPGLTASRFVADPFGHGDRLYRTGDLVRWTADGLLEFLGRTDDQVKIRGFRVEPGEVEAALRRHPEVTEVVVVPHEHVPGHRQLVAYVVAGAGADELRRFLADRVPAHLVPAVIVPLPALPLMVNGKVDRRALPPPRARSDRAHVPPSGPHEEVLARVWAEVLGVERVGADDNFFALGGDSILSIQVVSRARELGVSVTPRDVFLHQTLSGVAAHATTARPPSAEREPATGPVPLTPVQHWFLATSADPAHFAQWLEVELEPDVDVAALRAAVEALPVRHDLLRARFERVDGQWRQHVPEESGEVLTTGPLVPAEWRAPLATGPLFRAVLSTDASRLVLLAHHLVVDGVSWRILLEDLATGYDQAAAGRPVDLGPRTTSFREWARRLHAEAGRFAEHLAYWERAVAATAGLVEPVEAGRSADLRYGDRGVAAASGRDVAVPADRPESADRAVAAEPDETELPEHAVTVRLSAEETAALLRGAATAYRAGAEDVLVAAVGRVLGRWSGQARVPLELEGHGREEVFAGVDLSRTVGWFTTLFPFTAELPDADWGTAVKTVKEQLRTAHRHALSHSVLRWLTTSHPAGHRPLARVNYLGRYDAVFTRVPGGIRLAKPPTTAPRLDVTAAVTAGGELEVEWVHAPEAHPTPVVERIAEDVLAALREITAHCAGPGAGGVTPSDFPLARLTQDELDVIAGDGRSVEDVYPLTPAQGGMLFHSLSRPDAYVEQLHLTLTDADPDGLARAWRRVVDANPALRTSVVWAEVREPVQVVRRSVDLPITHHDWRGAADDERWRRLLAEDRAAGFDLSAHTLTRLAFVRTGDREIRLLWTFHHLLLDGWSAFQVLSEVLGGPRSRRPFRDHVARVLRQDPSEERWRALFDGFRGPTALPYDRPPDRAHLSCSSAVHVTGLPAGVRGFARRNRLTLGTVAQGAWALLLARHGGTRDVCFGLVVSGRTPDLPGADTVVGMLVNTVPVRVRVETEDVPGWLARLQAEGRPADHAALTDIRRWAGLPAGTPLFDSVVVVENYPLDHDVAAVDVQAVENTNYPLHLVVHDTEPLTAQLGYDPDLFDAATAATLLDEFAALLADLGNAAPAVPPDRATRPVDRDDPPANGPARFVPPATPGELAVARAWADVLGVDRVGRGDDFFALGGDSLLALRVAARLRPVFGRTVAPRTLFDHPTVGALAAVLGSTAVEDAHARDYQL